MELEDYFHIIQRSKDMNPVYKYEKDTRVSFSISQDNDDSDYPNTSHSVHNDYSGPTWMQIVEDILKTIEASYGYEIRSKVYYAVDCPLFDHDVSPAPGREIDSTLFKELLKRYPELNNNGEHKASAPFFTTTEEDDEDSSDS